MNRYVVLARFDKNTEEKLIALRREMRLPSGRRISRLRRMKISMPKRSATGQGSLSANTRAKSWRSAL